MKFFYNQINATTYRQNLIYLFNKKFRNRRQQILTFNKFI